MQGQIALVVKKKAFGFIVLCQCLYQRQVIVVTCMVQRRVHLSINHVDISKLMSVHQYLEDS